MKKLIPLLFAVTACAAVGNKETHDSTAVADITFTPDSLVDDESNMDEPVFDEPSDTSNLISRYDEISQANEAVAETYHRVNIVTSQYEASSEVIWYFDNSFEPRFFVMSWSVEGSEGVTSYFIENGDVVCAKEEDNFATEKWCSTTGGIRTRYNDEGEITGKELLPDTYSRDLDVSLRRYLDILASLLKDGKRTEQDENTYTIRMEETVNYGQEFTESTEVTIPKKVYDALVN